MSASSAGTGEGAGLAAPAGVAVIGSAAFVLDADVIMRVELSGSSTGVATVLAGQPGVTSSCTDSDHGSGVTFRGQPYGLVTDGTFLYSSSNCGLRRTDPSTGATTTIASDSGPVTFGSDGKLYVAKGYYTTYPVTLLRVDPSNGSATTAANVTTSPNSYAMGVAADAAGNVYTSVYDGSVSPNTRIIKTVLSSSSSSILVADVGLTNQSGLVAGLAVAGGYVYAAASGGANSVQVRVRRYPTSGGPGADVAGGAPGHLDAPAGKAALTDVTGLTSDGTNLFAVEQGGYLRKLAPTSLLASAQPDAVSNTPYIGFGDVASLAGSGAVGTSAAGTGAGVGLSSPAAVAVIGAAAFVLDADVIMRVELSGSSTGVATVLAGQPGVTSSCTDSDHGSGVTFRGQPYGLVTDGTFLYSSSNCGLRRTDPSTGATTTIASDSGPVTFGSDGKLYVTEVREVAYNTYSVTLVRVDPANGSAVSFASITRSPYTSVSGMTADTAGNLYTSVYDGSASPALRLLKTVATSGATTVVAGFATASEERVLAFLDGTLYGSATVSDALGHSVVLLVATDPQTGGQTTVAGGSRGTSSAVGVGAAAGFASIDGITSDGTDLFLADAQGGFLRRVMAAPPPPIPTEQTFGTSGLLDDGSSSNGGGCVCPTAADSSTVGGATGDPVNTATGAQVYSVNDGALPSAGTPFDWTRTYTSADTAAGPFGPGWSFPYGASLTTGSGGAVTLRAEDGQRAIYTPDGAGGYVSPPGIQSVLAAVSGGGWTVTTREHQRDTFNADGQLTRRQDRYGQGLNLAYTAGVIASVTDAAGRTVTVSWSGGRVSGFTLPDGRGVTYGYTSGRLTSATDLRGKTWTYGYDSSSRLTSVTDPLGHVVFTDVYGTDGRVSSQTDPRGKKTTFGWTAATGTATTTDPRGGKTVDVYSGNVLTSRTTPAGTTRYTYDARGLMVRTTEPRGYGIAYRYDGAGRKVVEVSGLITRRWSYDGDGDVLTATDGRGNVTTNTYDGQQRPATVTDAKSGVTRYTYATGLQVATVTDRRGKTTSYGYDTAGNRTSATTPAGERTTWTYDGSGRALTRVAARGNATGGAPADYTTTWAHDAADHVTMVTDAVGRATRTDYDDAGNPTVVTDATGAATTTTYDPTNRPLALVAHAEAGSTSTTTYTYDDSGNLASSTDPVGGTTSYGYDLASRRTSTVSPLGNVTGATAATKTARTTTYGYDALGDLTSVSVPDPVGGTARKTSYTYDRQARRVSQTDPLGHQTLVGYDADSNVTGVTDPLGHTTTTGYDELDRPTTVTDPRGYATTTGYDPEGHVTRTTSPLGEVTTGTYDDDGRPATTVEPRGNASGGTPSDYTTSYAYDPEGHLVAVTDPLSHTTGYGYDPVGNRSTVTDPLGHTTSWTYDPLDRTATVRAPDAPAGKVTSTAYDGLGNPTSRTDPLGHTTTWAYDAASRPTAMTLPDGARWAYGYDADGNTSSTVTAKGNTAGNTTAQIAAGTMTRGYDTLDRPTSVAYGDGTPTVTWAYDGAGRRTTLTDGAGTETRSYDNADRLTKVVRTPTGGTAETYSYGYDAAENLTSRTLPGSTAITTGYDNDGRATSLTADGATTTYGYDPAGHLTAATLPGTTGTMSSWTWDTAGRLTSVSNTQGSTVLSNVTRTLDPVGNPTGTVTTRGTTSRADAFSFDPADRLTGACYGTSSCSTTGTGAVTWSYDLVGNRTTETRTGDTLPSGASAATVTTTSGYDVNDQLTGTTVTGAPGGTTLGYDADGNQTRAGPTGSPTTTSTYDLAAQLTSSSTGSTTTSYTYDGNNDRRTATSTSGGSTTASTVYGWDVNDTVDQLATETATTGGSTTTRSYRYTPPTDLPASYTATEATGPLYDLTDDRKNVSDVIDGTGAAQWAYDTEPFGLPRTTTQVAGAAKANPLRFTGAYTDPASGLLDLRARQYDPATGRFTGRDPLAQPPATAASGSYAYAGGNPLTRWDPTGQSWHDITSTVSGAITGTASVVGDTVTGIASTVAHPVATYQAFVSSCNAGFDQYSNDRLAGLAQCVDNLNPAARTRDDLSTSWQAYQAGCIQQGAHYLFRGLTSGAALVAPGLGEETAAARIAASSKTRLAPIRAAGEEGSAVDPVAYAALRREFSAVRNQYWQDRAGTAKAGEFNDVDLARMRQGKGPIGSDGKTVELHHRQPLIDGGTNSYSNLEEMTQTDHRGSGNYHKNHPRP